MYSRWVDTAMGRRVITGDGSMGGIPANEAATKIVNVIDELKSEDSPNFVGRDGESISW
jgi:hypothetical protein